MDRFAPTAARLPSVDVVYLTGGSSALRPLIDALRTAHPHITWAVRPSIGEAPGVIEAIADASLAGLSGHLPMNSGSVDPA